MGLMERLEKKVDSWMLSERNRKGTARRMLKYAVGLVALGSAVTIAVGWGLAAFGVIPCGPGN